MSADDWSERWSRLARGAGLDPRESVLLALSGGADSVYLLQVLAASRERPVVAAVHVEHGLRGAESLQDARFCSRRCARLGIPFELRRIRLDPQPSGLEARARSARYEALFEAAHDLGFRTILTGHHADDALETVLLRWLRGTDLGGLAGLKPELELAPRSGEPSGARVPGQDLAPRQPLRIVRPLISMRREEVRSLLSAAHIAWREDSTNRDERFLRNRVRRLVPRLVALGGPSTLDNLRAFGAAVESLERHLAEATAHLAWQPPSHAVATRSLGQAQAGGTLPRAALMRLPTALRRRALWRLVLEATGRAPRRALLDALLDDLGSGRCGRHALPRGCALLLRSAEITCVSPTPALASASAPRQLRLPFDAEGAAPRDPQQAEGALLSVPGELQLSDGRVLCAELVRVDASAPAPRGRCEVELDAERPPDALRVRFARPGDRFHPLGAPGRRPLRRFLADSGVPREERGRVLLVLREGEIAWVAGLRPAETFRVGPRCALRLRLRLLNGAPEPALAPSEPERDLAASGSALQGELWVGSAR